jgi:predicted nucleotidyltransferase
VTAENLQLPLDEIREICRRYGVRELAIFGSALGPEFGPGSDIDLLVEFESDVDVGFLTLAGMQRELSEVLGRKVDLVPKGGLKPRIREAVLSSAEVLYAA